MLLLLLLGNSCLLECTKACRYKLENQYLQIKNEHHLYHDKRYSTQDMFEVQVIFLLKAFEGTGNWFLDQSEDI